MKDQISPANAKKIKLFESEIKDLTQFEEKITNLYISEFEDKLANILNVKESEFMSNFSLRMNLIIEDMYSSKVFNYKNIQGIMKKSERIVYERFYLSNYQILSKAIKDYEKSFNCVILTNFHKHCGNNDEQAIHVCMGKLMQVSSNYVNGVGIKKSTPDDKKLINTVSHVICLGCKKCYLSNSIILFCKACKTDYYTSVLLVNENNELKAATWEKYHCGALINDMMRCIKCKEIFYLKFKENLLVCKSCKFQADPMEIMWTCFICSQEFKTKAKFYNQMQFKLIRNAIREALLYKIKAYPSRVPCCNLKVENTSFIHKSECPGILYKGEMNGQAIIVCEECKMMNFESKFVWSCTSCFKKFKDEKDFSVPIEPSSDKNLISKEQNLSNHKKKISMDFGCKSTLNLVQVNNKAGLKHSVSGNFSMTPSKLSSSPVKKRQEAPIINNVTQINLCETNIEEKRDTKSPIRQIVLNNIPQSKPINDKENYIITDRRPSGFENQQDLFSQMDNKKMKNNNISRNDNQNFVQDDSKPLNNSNIFNISIKNVNVITNYSMTPSYQFQENNNKKRESDNISPSKRNNNADIITPIKNNNNISRKISKEESMFNDKEESIRSFNFDYFQLLQQIGEGSYGHIYLAIDKNNRKFAMKKLIINDEKQVAMYIDEFNLVYSCKHPNVLSIYGYHTKKLDETTYALYVLMELASHDWDKEIKNRILAKNFYSENELIQILTQIVGALSFLQQNNVAHRDIKPQNVLVFPNNIYKVADFGEAKEVLVTKQTSTLRGTELYMSPLLFAALRSNKNDISHDPYKSDVFSLAFCLIYAATLTYNPIYDLRKTNDVKTVDLIINKYFLNKFSGKFINLLRKVIVFNESKRFDFIELEKYLKDNF